jgi:hypothetical protein
MSLIDKLATSLGRKDEAPNIALAEIIARKKDLTAVRELIDILQHKDKNLQSDAIKVLYEIGERDAKLIADHGQIFLALLKQQKNRLVWGALTALDAIADIKPKALYHSLPEILDVAAKGSVISRDHAVNILIKLCRDKRYITHVMPLLLSELASCPVNQLPMYAERALPVVTADIRQQFQKTLESRMEEIAQDSKRRRIEKIILRIKSRRD